MANFILFKLFHLTLFIVIYGYLKKKLFLKNISPEVTLVYYTLFHLKLFLAILNNFDIRLLVIGYSFIETISGY